MIINSDGAEPTSSERRPDDPPYGLDPVVHVRLGVGHEQEGLMADWCAVLLSCSTCVGGEGIRETGESSEKGDRLEADGFTDAQERVEEVGVRDTTLPL